MRFLTNLCLASTLLIASGCSLFNKNSRKEYDGPGTVSQSRAPSAQSLIAYLNGNAQKVQGLQCNNLTLTVAQGSQSGTLPSAKLFCQKPRNFRLVAKIVSSPGVDFGSNNDEFWYWISKSEYPNVVFHCPHEALEKGSVKAPFPFRPEMVLNVLGIAEYDPNGKYEVKVTESTYELIESTVSPQGKPMQKVTVFNKRRARPGDPQVLAYLLKDENGKDISSAKVIQAQTVELGQGAVVTLPRRVELEWPEQKVSMKMKLDGLRATNYSPSRAAAIFSRGNLTSLKAFNLATNQYDGGLQRAGHTSPDR